MRKDLLLLSTLVFIVLLISPAFAVTNLDNYPRLDTIYTKMCLNESDVITKASTGVLDTAYDIRQPANVATLQALSPPWNISTNDGYGFHYWGVNCRDYTPAASGVYANYHNRVPGVPLFPLNMSQFRYALHLLIGGAITNNALAATFGWTQKRIDTIPAPAAGYWHDAALPPIPYDPVQAMSILNSIGFSNTTAGHVGVWWCSIPGHVGELRTIWVLGSTQAIHSTTQMSKYYCTAWNNFFGKNSTGYYYFGGSSADPANVDVLDFTIVVYIYSYNRDPDIWGGGWTVGQNPDYLHDFFSSDNDGVNNYNAPGIHNALLDTYLFAIKYWRWPNGTYITSLYDTPPKMGLINITYAAQEMLYYLQPYMVSYCSVVVNAFNPGLRQWIESLGYGSDIGWSYNWIYWADLTKTSIDQCDASAFSSLNPEVASTVYDFEILSRIYDGLYDNEPFLHNDIMWAMKSYTIAPWIQPSIGVQYGQAVTINLRHSLRWQSGDPINASDIKWNYDFIWDQQLERYSDIIQTYYNTTTYNTDPYKLTIYMNCTGIWTVYTYLGNALIFPKKVWQHWYGDHTAAPGAWTPWTVNYDTWTGSTGHGALTCLIGTGAWIFLSYDNVAQAATLVANRKDAVYTGNPGYWAANFLREDVNFDGIVDAKDMFAVQKAYGAIPANPRWNHGMADVDFSGRVDARDMFRVQKRYGKKTLPTP